MWEFELLIRDSGMSGVFAGYSSKNRDGWYLYKGKKKNVAISLKRLRSRDMA